MQPPDIQDSKFPGYSIRKTSAFWSRIETGPESARLAIMRPSPDAQSDLTEQRSARSPFLDYDFMFFCAL